MASRASDPDTLYRSFLRPLAASLVPPSSPVISSLLSCTSSSLAPLLSQPVDWAHNEQNIDFWDARRAGREWEGARGERWEMSREEVEGVKAARKGWGEAVKRAEDEDEDERAGRVPWLASRPPSLKDDFLLPRHSACALAPAPPSDYLAQLAELVGGGRGEGGETGKKLVLVKPDEAMRTMDAMPDLVVALDLKLALSAAEFAQLKQAREKYKALGQLGAREALRTREGEEEGRERDKYPRAASPTPGTPPLFARRLSFLPQESPRAVDLSTAMGDIEVLPSSSSPFGSGGGTKSQRAWNKEEDIPSSLPISPSALLSSLAQPVPVWSSSGNPPSELPDRLDGGGDGGGMEVERPVFPRARSLGSGEGGAVDFAKLVAGFEDGREVDQLESDPPSSSASRFASPIGGCVGGAIDGLLGTNEGTGLEEGVLRSDETMGGEEAREAGMRLKVPRLPPAAAALPSPPIPSLAAFSPLTAPPTSTAPSRPALSAPWSLTPATGLRSLTISLGWDAPPRAGAFDEAAGTGEDEGGDEELVRAAKEERDGRMRAFEEAAAAMEADREGERVGWPAAPLDGQDGEEEEQEEELRPRRLDALPLGKEEEQEEERETEAATTSTLVATSALTGQDAPASPDGGNDERAGELNVDDEDDSLSTLLDFVDPPQAPPPAADSSCGVVNGSSSSASGFIYADLTPPHSLSPSAASFVPFTSLPSPHEPPASPPSLDRPDQRGASLDSLVLRRFDAQNGVEKANLDPPVSSTTTALDRFLSLRGRGALVSDAQQQSPARPSPQPPAHPEPTHSSPPPGSIPFSLPPFLLAEDAAPSLRRSTPLRIVAHDAFLPLRAHHAALTAEGFEVVHRSSRFEQQREGEGKVLEPHLIVDPGTAVLFIKLVDLLAGGPVVRPAELAALSSATPTPSAPTTTNSTTPKREAVYTSLVRLSRRFDRLLLVLEEPSAAPGRVKPYAYTPPILKALSDLAGALERLNAGGGPAVGREEGGGTVEVEVVLSKGAGHSAELVGRYCAWLERREEEKEEGGGVVRLWDERQWLTDDPGEDETALLRLPDLNEFSASLVLAISSLGDFLSTSADDRAALFDGLIGKERINRISASLAASRAPSSPVPSRSSTSASPSTFIALSQIADLASADEDEGGADQFFTFDDAFDLEKYDAMDE